MYAFVTEINLLSRNLSGFRNGDTTINQLLSLTTEIFNAIEDFDAIRDVFIAISEDFDKV